MKKLILFVVVLLAVSMAFADDGTLYAAASPSGDPFGGYLYTLNSNTGQMTLIGPIGSSHIDIDTLTYAPDGFLYGVDTLSVSGTDLYKIEPSTGNRTFVVQLPGGVNGLHVTPEPATLGLLLIGGLALLGRRGGVWSVESRAWSVKRVRRRA